MLSLALRLLVLIVAVGIAPATHAAAKIQRVTTSAGIEAWLVQEPRIPIIAAEIAWRGGSALEPVGREGLARMLAGLLDEGAGDLDANTFKAALEDKAISLSFNADRDHMRASLKTLSEHRDEAFRLLGLALTQPRLDAEPLARVRGQLLVQLQRSAADPDSIAARTWNQTAFAGHAYGRPAEGTNDSLNAITRDDLATFAKARFARDNIVIGVVGDIGPDELKRLLDGAFGGLPERAVPATLAPIQPAVRAAPLVIERDIPQSVVLFGGPGLKRADPDWYAGYVANYILGGGGFASRLTEEVREKRGLVYSVYSYLQPMDATALQIGGLGTRNETAGEAIALVKAEIRRLRETGVTETELRNAKSYLTGSFPLRLSSNGRIAGTLVAMQLDHLGIDYLERYNSLIGGVTLADVNRVVRRLMDPDALLTVVVGKPSGLGG